MKAIILALAMLVACSSSNRLTGLNATQAGLMGAKVGFDLYDEQHTIDIVDQAKAKGETLEQEKADRAAYKVTQQKILGSFQHVFALLSGAYQANDNISLGLLTDAVTELRAELALIGVKL